MNQATCTQAGRLRKWGKIGDGLMTETLIAPAKLCVFISYSRRDALFADWLVTALERREIDVLIDRRDLPTLEDWERELFGFIQRADTIVFIVSQNSIRSSVCAWEVEQDRAQAKRLAPVVLEDVDSAIVPDSISRINYLFLPTARCLSDVQTNSPLR